MEHLVHGESGRVSSDHLIFIFKAIKGPKNTFHYLGQRDNSISTVKAQSRPFCCSKILILEVWLQF